MNGSRRPRPVRVAGAVAAAASVALAIPAGAATSAAPTHLSWTSPHSIQAGQAGDFHSIDPCPATRPDGSPIVGARMVQLSVLFPKESGGVGNVFPVEADGSWAATWDPGVAVTLRHGRSTVTAECLDVTFTGVDLARYRAHTIN